MHHILDAIWSATPPPPMIAKLEIQDRCRAAQGDNGRRRYSGASPSRSRSPASRTTSRTSQCRSSGPRRGVGRGDGVGYWLQQHADLDLRAGLEVGFMERYRVVERQPSTEVANEPLTGITESGRTLVDL